MRKQTVVTLLMLVGATGTLAHGQAGAGKAFEARDPVVCKSKKDPAKGAPSGALLKNYVQCRNEGVRGYLVLFENVQVEIGKSRPYSSQSDSGASDIDRTQPLYPIRGTGDDYNCWAPHPASAVYPVYAGDSGKNCKVQKASPFIGSCYKTTFSEWSCPIQWTEMLGTWVQGVAPPK